MDGWIDGSGLTLCIGGQLAPPSPFRMMPMITQLAYGLCSISFVCFFQPYRSVALGSFFFLFCSLRIDWASSQAAALNRINRCALKFCRINESSTLQTPVYNGRNQAHRLNKPIFSINRCQINELSLYILYLKGRKVATLPGKNFHQLNQCMFRAS